MKKQILLFVALVASVVTTNSTFARSIKNVGKYNNNCTVAFSLSSANCVIKYDTCMDYNGWGSNCSGSNTYFLGSDCSKAMALGHCWNEVMN